MCGKERPYRVLLINVNATFAVRFFFSATTVLNVIRANFCSSAMWNVLDIFYEQIYVRNNGYSAGRTKYRHRKKKIIFLKTLKQRLQSSFSLSKIFGTLDCI